MVSAGDVSDVDGLFAVAEYSKTGADLLYVMNYPAYVAVGAAERDRDYAERNPGLGYRYGARDVLERDRGAGSEAYARFLGRYEGPGRDSDGGRARGPDSERDPDEEQNRVMRRALTDLAFHLVARIWAEGPADRGRLLFCIGGINAINPFSAASIKNEVLVFADLVSGPAASLPPEEGAVYDADGARVDFSVEGYRDIYMDFNGSMAHWDEAWAERLTRAATAGSVKGVFVMGGVLTEHEPVTIASIPGVLNRFSSATMNQLYHPQRAADFFSFLGQYRVETYFVTNNAVEDISTFSVSQPKARTDEGLKLFLAANELRGAFLLRTAVAYYGPGNTGARKPFDFYTALALRLHMTAAREAGGAGAGFVTAARSCYYSNVYGITCVSRCSTWEEARAEYIAHVDLRPPQAGEDERAAGRRAAFRAEAGQMGRVDRMAVLPVQLLHFDLDRSSFSLSVQSGRGRGREETSNG